MRLTLDLQIATGIEGGPSEAELRGWVEAALVGRREEAELAVRVMDEAEARRLNRTYRGVDAPTNVLSFPYEDLPGTSLPLLGDLAICAPVVEREAREQGKPLDAHWAHMVVHGVLHLLGFDHQTEEQASKMERLEAEVLADLGYTDPYRESNGA